MMRRQAVPAPAPSTGASQPEHRSAHAAAPGARRLRAARSRSGRGSAGPEHAGHAALDEVAGEVRELAASSCSSVAPSIWRSLIASTCRRWR